MQTELAANAANLDQSMSDIVRPLIAAFNQAMRDHGGVFFPIQLRTEREAELDGAWEQVLCAECREAIEKLLGKNRAERNERKNHR